MAIIHQATLSPGKIDLLREHLKHRSALSAYVDGELSQVGAYRFDDPAGQVGIETHILTNGAGALLQLPLCYRNEQLTGAEESFLGTMEHSVLGTRWVYDACIDPIYVSELLRTILTGGTEVDEIVETPDGPVARETTAKVLGSGSESTAPHVTAVSSKRVGTESHIATGEHTLVVSHLLAEGDAPSNVHLSGRWASRESPITLAYIA